MNVAVAGQNHVVSNLAMAPDHRAIGEDAAIADEAIMRDMAIGHEVIVTADTSGPGVGGAAMDGDAFAKDVVVADFQTSRLSLVLQMLWPFTQYRASEDQVLPAHEYGAAQMGMWPNDTTGT